MAGKHISRRRGLLEFSAHHVIDTKKSTCDKLSGKETSDSASTLGRHQSQRNCLMTVPGLGKKATAEHFVIVNPTDGEAVYNPPPPQDVFECSPDEQEGIK